MMENYVENSINFYFGIRIQGRGPYNVAYAKQIQSWVYVYETFSTVCDVPSWG